MTQNWLIYWRQKSGLKDRNVIVDFSSVTLRDALGDPDDVSAFLLFQLEEGVEDAEVELLHECIHVQFDLGTENKKSCN